jgi:Tfp pilus assembly protein PilE
MTQKSLFFIVEDDIVMHRKERQKNSRMRFNVRGKSGITLVEIMVAVVITAIILGISFASYKHIVERAKSTEAIVNVDTIRKAEEVHRVQTGSYIAAKDINQINELFNLVIKPKYYDFRIVLPDEDSYIVIAQRLGEDIEAYLAAGQLPPNPIVIAMGESGYVDSGFGIYIGSGTPGPGGSSGTSGSGGTSGTSGTGSSGGTSGSGSSGGTSGTTSGGGTGGVVSSPVVARIPVVQVYDSDIVGALNMLDGSDVGQYAYDLIERKKISVIYDDFTKPEYKLSSPDNILGFWWFTTDTESSHYNTIFINENLKEEKSESVIASVICHEAVHADYDYNPERRIALTLERHPELTRDDFSIDRYENGEEIIYPIYDPESEEYERRVFIRGSLDEEYNAFATDVELWKEIKGTESDWSMDRDLATYEQGEAAFKADLRTRSSYVDLPEY